MCTGNENYGRNVFVNGLNYCKLPMLILERRVGKMFTKSELERCRNAEIFNVNKNDLYDLSFVSIDRTQPVIKRASKYFDTVKNPYIFRVGDVGVKINCVGNKSLTDSIIDIAELN